MLLQYCTVVLLMAVVQSERLLFKPQDGPNMIKVLPETSMGFSEKPKFCKKLDCPDYSVVESGKGYELREYANTQWVSTTLTGVDYRKASSMMFMKLFRYIQGMNDKKEKIAMTVPVLVRLIPGPGPACESNFTMSFYLSNKIQDPPKPTDPNVFLNTEPVFRAYVRQFSGYVRKIDEWIGEAQELIQAIGDTSKYHTDFYFTAGYNSPFELLFRHNEIWFISK